MARLTGLNVVFGGNIRYQGGDYDNRLAKGYEYTAKYNLGHDVPYEPYRSHAGRYNYPAISEKARGRFSSIYERVFHHYHDRMGLEMPFTGQVLEKIRPERWQTAYASWGTLMHAGQPGAATRQAERRREPMKATTADYWGASVLLVWLLITASARAQEPGVPTIVDLGSRRELFVDGFLIDRLENTTLKLHHPVSGGVAIKRDKPWEGAANAGIAVFRHAGRLLMYYRAMTVNQGDVSGRLGVAVSEDGVSWEKPNLRRAEYDGRKDTNIVTDDAGNALMVIPWLDTRPGVPESERIKAFYSEAVSGEEHTAFRDPRGPKRLVMFVSADGFTFRKLDPQPEIISKLPNSFDGGNTMFRSDVEQQYVLYFRIWDGGRSIGRMTSKDFLHWSEPVPMTYGDSPREQLYTNQTQPYFHAPHLYIAPAARFMERRRVVTDEQVQAIKLKTSQGHFYGNDCSDAVLLTARAGSTQYDRTFMEAFVRPGLGASNWVSRTNYPLTGLLANGPEQMMFFIARHYMQDSWHIERLLLRTDGFASVHAPWSGGEMVTKPLKFSGHELSLNYSTSAAGSVRVEIQDTTGSPCPGFSLADCREIIGDEIHRIVRWSNGSDVSGLAGQPVRLRFVLRDADLFAIQFCE